MSDNPQTNPEMREVRLVMPPLKPVVTNTLFAITVAIFLVQLATQSFMELDIPATLGMKVNALIAHGQVWRLITPMFLHGSILHVALNMYALFILGRGLEQYYGHTRFLWLYFLSGFAGNVISMLFSPHNSLGSSTAIFGLIAAQGVFVYQNRKVFGGNAQRALMNVFLVAGLNFIIGMSPGIDNWGHLGGFIAGIAFSWLAGPMLQPVLTHDPNGQPIATLADQRDQHDVYQAILIVGVVFIFLAAGGIYFYKPK
ncbi:MAG: rhomboid family intramembrane serine protease [Chloroflexota bacterium]